MSDRPAPDACHYCGVSGEQEPLKPFGPGRAPVCLGCVTDPAHPERETLAREIFLRDGHRVTIIHMDE